MRSKGNEMKLIYKWIPHQLLFFVFISALPQLTWAKSVYGVFRVVKGDVNVLSHKKNGQKIKAKVGQKVYPKDVILTGKDSRSKIVMIDENVINISPDSKVEIEKYEYSPKENKKNVLLGVLYGKVRSKVNQKYDGDKNKFQVKTPSAVAGVRGTDFLASYNSAQNATQVVTFEGQVAFGLPGANGAIINPVKINVGQVASSIAGNVPTPPKMLPPQELKKIEVQSDADKANNNTSANEPAPKEQNQKKPDKKDEKKAQNNDKKTDNKGPNKEDSKTAKKAPNDKKPNVNKEGDSKNQNQGPDSKNQANGGPKPNGPPGDKNGPDSLAGGPEGPPPPPGEGGGSQPGSERAPSSLPPMGDGMMLDSDLPDTAVIDTGQFNPLPVPIYQDIPQYEPIPICETCNEFISDKTRLRIIIKNQ